MIRRVFRMQLKPGALAEYTRQHNAIWPELVEEIRACGIHSITIVEEDPMLVLYSEIETEDAWDKLWNSEIHKRWGEVMNAFLAFRPDGIVDSKTLPEIWHLDT